jgi:hypothetical protein
MKKLIVFGVFVFLFFSVAIAAAPPAVCPTSCHDSDDGKNYNVKGYVDGVSMFNKRYNYTDSCIIPLNSHRQPVQLQEWSCREVSHCGRPFFKIAYCKFGCFDGRCIDPNEVPDEVPEFGTIAAMIALAGAVSAYMCIRKN